MIKQIDSTDVLQIEFDASRQSDARDVVQVLLTELRTKYGDAVVVLAPPSEVRVR